MFCGALMGAGHRLPLVQQLSRRGLHGRRGSLALGGALGTLALLTKAELLLPFIGGLFVVEAASVILQVASFS